MAIRVRHSPGIQTTGQMAFESAYQKGQRQRQRQDRQFGLEQERFEESQRQFDERMGLRRDRFEYQQEEDETEREFRERMQQAQQEDILERKRVAEDLQRDTMKLREKERRGTIKYRYTQKQKAEMNRLSEALERVRQSDEFSESEKAEAERQIIGQMANMKKVPQLQDDQPPKMEQFEQETIQQDGIIYGQNEKGEWEKVADSPAQVTNQDMMDAYEKAYQMELQAAQAGVAEGETVERPSHDEVMKRAEQIIKKRKEIQRDMEGRGESEQPEGEGTGEQKTDGRQKKGEQDIQEPEMKSITGVTQPDVSKLPKEQRAQVKERWNQGVNQIEDIEQAIGEAREEAQSAEEGTMQEIQATSQLSKLKEQRESLKKQLRDAAYNLRNQMESSRRQSTTNAGTGGM